MAKLEDIHAEALERFEWCASADSRNRLMARDDIRFLKMKEQWPEVIRLAREEAGQPCLVIDKLGAVVRQVLNDARMNKPSIKVKPVDSQADPKTAEIISGLIRNIEYTSNADVAYDTGLDYAVSSGRGYWRVNAEYSSDDTFDQDLCIERIADPMTVYPDPFSTAADSSDWNYTFVTELVSKDEYRRRYRGKDVTDWDDIYMMRNDWVGDEAVVIAEYWVREEVEAYALMLSTGETVKSDESFSEGDIFSEGVPLTDPEGNAVIGPMSEEPLWLEDPVEVIAVRPVKSHKVTQYIMSGKEVLETTEWPGVFIPIVPVYGEDFTFEGRRYFSSMIRPAKDAQRMQNYWRSKSTELVALAPVAPWIGPEEAFQGDDDDKWATANTGNHAYISYKGHTPPQRQPFAGVPAGALQEALNASDDIKSITGIYDASLGARSNETSGRAILARQREGDVSTFHYIDNLSRSIRHTGRILIDLIPHYYSTDRVIRILNPEGEPENVQVGSPEHMQEMQRLEGEIEQIYALGVGKYDVAVDSGPSFTTQREEANMFLTELLRSAPQYADVIGPLLLRTYDFPGVDKLIEDIERRQQAAEEQAGQPTPEQQEKMIQAQMKQQEQLVKAQEFTAEQELEWYKAETDRLNTLIRNSQPRPAPRIYG